MRKKSRLNSEKIWKIEKKVSWIVKRFGKYRRKLWKRYEQYGRKEGWIFSLFTLLFLHIFHIFSLFNSSFFHIFHIFSHFIHIFHIISQFSSLFSKSSDKIWKIQKKSKLNGENIWKIQKKIVKKYGKYGRNVKWYWKYGGKVSWIVKRFGK
jgi:hypothetical protein